MELNSQHQYVSKTTDLLALNAESRETYLNLLNFPSDPNQLESESGTPSFPHSLSISPSFCHQDSSSGGDTSAPSFLGQTQTDSSAVEFQKGKNVIFSPVDTNVRYFLESSSYDSRTQNSSRPPAHKIYTKVARGNQVDSFPRQQPKQSDILLEGNSYNTDARICDKERCVTHQPITYGQPAGANSVWMPQSSPTNSYVSYYDGIQYNAVNLRECESIGKPNSISCRSCTPLCLSSNDPYNIIEHSTPKRDQHSSGSCSLNKQYTASTGNATFQHSDPMELINSMHSVEPLNWGCDYSNALKYSEASTLAVPYWNHCTVKQRPDPTLVETNNGLRIANMASHCHTNSCVQSHESRCWPTPQYAEWIVPSINLPTVYCHAAGDRRQCVSSLVRRPSSIKRTTRRRRHHQWMHSHSLVEERVQPADSEFQTGLINSSQSDSGNRADSVPKFDMEALGRLVPDVSPEIVLGWLHSNSPLFNSVCMSTQTHRSDGFDQRKTNGTEIHLRLRDAKTWSQIHAFGTEMIATNTGRRIFPSLSIDVTGLCPTEEYVFVLDMILIQPHVFKHQGGQWMISTQSPDPKTVDQQAIGRFYVQDESPKTGAYWMESGVNFTRAKITNNRNHRNASVIHVYSMHQYAPRFTILRVRSSGQTKGRSHQSEDVANFSHLSVVPQPRGRNEYKRPPLLELVGCYVIPGTQFYTVTAYQNPDVIRVKIDNNPFAKGFRNRQSQQLLDVEDLLATYHTPFGNHDQRSSCSNSEIKMRKYMGC